MKKRLVTGLMCGILAISSVCSTSAAVKSDISKTKESWFKSTWGNDSFEKRVAFKVYMDAIGDELYATGTFAYVDSLGSTNYDCFSPGVKVGSVYKADVCSGARVRGCIAPVGASADQYVWTKDYYKNNQTVGTCKINHTNSKTKFGIRFKIN